MNQICLQKKLRIIKIIKNIDLEQISHMCPGCINSYPPFSVIDVVKVNCDSSNVFVPFKNIFKKKHIYSPCKSTVTHFLLNTEMCYNIACIGISIKIL